MIPAAEGHCRWSSARIACRRIQGTTSLQPSEGRRARWGRWLTRSCLTITPRRRRSCNPGTEGAGTGCARDQADAAGVRRQDEAIAAVCVRYRALRARSLAIRWSAGSSVVSGSGQIVAELRGTVGEDAPDWFDRLGGERRAGFALRGGAAGLRQSLRAGSRRGAGIGEHDAVAGVEITLGGEVFGQQDIVAIEFHMEVMHSARMGVRGRIVALLTSSRMGISRLSWKTA